MKRIIYAYIDVYLLRLLPLRATDANVDGNNTISQFNGTKIDFSTMKIYNTQYVYYVYYCTLAKRV